LKHVEDIRALTDILLSSSNFHSFVIEGAPGWGKSTTVERVLAEKGVPFKALGSYTTPLALFKFLSQNQKELLVIDDCAGIFGDTIAMAILKAATWPSSGSDGTRLVSWATTSERVKLDSFFFDGKIILLTNSTPTSGDGRAFASRSLHYCITPTTSDMEAIVLSTAESSRFVDQTRAQKVAQCLLERGRQTDFRGVNLRTLQMGYELATSGRPDWLSLFLKVLPTPDPTHLAYLISSREGTVEAQFREFHRQTGLSRRTFFYHRARVTRDGR
jgi:hypothetical protein